MRERAIGSRRLPANAWLFDSGLALVAAGLSTAFFVFELVGSGLPGGILALGYALALVHTLPLAARRRFPGAVLALSVASGLAVAAFGLPPIVLGVAILVAVYSVAAYGDWWVSLASLAAAEVGSVAVQLTPGRFQAPTVVSNALVIGAAWLLGHFVGVRRAYTAQLEERTVELERAREELARRAVTKERLRLARELHDVVAHAMSVIAVQSGVGAHVANTQPEEAAKALAAIEATSRAALEELRRLLGVLRQDSEPQGDLTPVPGLADLDSLLAEVSKAGLGVRPRVEGTPSQLPAGVDLSAYRIVQEALTNVVKHAGPARAQVVVGYRDRAVTVEVTDDGRGAAAPAGDGQASVGQGLIGMRERVAAFGGDLEVGPRPGWGLPGGGAAAAGGRPAMTIRVVVADDQTLVRAGFRLLVDSAADLEVVGEAADGAEAVELARRERPDVVLMDIRMPRTDGLEATRQITADELLGEVRILVLTTFDLDEYVYAALRAGASGFLLKDTPPADLLAAIRVVAAGDALLAPAITRRLIAEFARRPDPTQIAPAALEALTDREREVLALVARGLSNAELAERLVVSPATSKTYVSRLLAKLAARDRAQLVAIAYETGLVTPSSR